MDIKLAAGEHPWVSPKCLLGPQTQWRQRSRGYIAQRGDRSDAGRQERLRGGPGFRYWFRLCLGNQHGYQQCGGDGRVKRSPFGVATGPSP